MGDLFVFDMFVRKHYPPVNLYGLKLQPTLNKLGCNLKHPMLWRFCKGLAFPKEGVAKWSRHPTSTRFKWILRSQLTSFHVDFEMLKLGTFIRCFLFGIHFERGGGYIGIPHFGVGTHHKNAKSYREFAKITEPKDKKESFHRITFGQSEQSKKGWWNIIVIPFTKT